MGFRAGDADISVGEAMDRIFRLYHYNKDDQKRMRFKVEECANLLFSGSSYDWSFFHFDDQDVVYGGDYVVVDGYSSIVRNITDMLPPSVQIHLNTTVLKVDYSAN